jgi:DNA-binding response OmpR family regulator
VVPLSGEGQRPDFRQLRGPAFVLVVLGQPLLAEVVRLALNHGQFLTRTARDVPEATALVAGWQPHLAIVDMDVANDELLGHLWAASTRIRRIPVIALTPRGDLSTKLAAFERGVDDILTIPFSPEELVARTLAIMRRTYRESVNFTPVISVGDLEIDLLHRRVRAGEIELHLTSLEQSLLYLLAANAGQLVTREQILDCLWGPDYVAGSNIVDCHVRNLRKKLQNHWQRPRFIVTVPGRGYRFVPTSAEEPIHKTGGGARDQLMATVPWTIPIINLCGDYLTDVTAPVSPFW